MDDLLKQIDDFHLTPRERLDAAQRIKQIATQDLDAVCELDLHCHSFYSDGYCSPTMRIFEAWRRKMKVIAIADHDVFDGQLEALEAADIFGIQLVPSIEFYTDRPGIEIIGHFPNIPSFKKLLESKIADDIIEPIRKAKKEQLSQMVARIPDCFAKMNFAAIVTDNDIDVFLRNGISTKGDISVVMWQKYGPELLKAGIADDVKDFQAKYTTQDEHLNVPLKLGMDLSPEAFVKRIRQWGGLPGLPHPSEFRKKEKLDNSELRKTIENLAKIGLQTIEVDGWRNAICPETGMHQTDLFEQMRQDFNNSHPTHPPLLFTNGSDDHNQPGEGLELGCGRNRNLRPEFGSYDNIKKLLERQKLINSS